MQDNNSTDKRSLDLQIVTSLNHHIDSEKVIFFSDPKKNGNALKQFSDVVDECFAKHTLKLEDVILQKSEQIINLQNDRTNFIDGLYELVDFILSLPLNHEQQNQANHLKGLLIKEKHE